MGNVQTKCWEVMFTGKARKQKTKLPPNILDALVTLLLDLSRKGPEVAMWPNFGRLQGKRGVYHCHLNKGKPRYVAVWKVTDREIKLIEVRYVGTHENADYRRID